MLGFDALGVRALGAVNSVQLGGTLVLGLAIETDSAIGLQVRNIGLPVETDAALFIQPAHLINIGLATETDTALQATVAHFVGIATETDRAIFVQPPLSIVRETDSALSVRPQRIKPIGLATETDTALAAAFAKGHSVTIGIAVEFDTALAVRLGRLNIAEETDEALPIQWVQTGYWPFNDLKPRHISIQFCANPIGGGMGMSGREPTIDSGN